MRMFQYKGKIKGGNRKKGGDELAGLSDVDALHRCAGLEVQVVVACGRHYFAHCPGKICHPKDYAISHGKPASLDSGQKNKNKSNSQEKGQRCQSIQWVSYCVEKLHDVPSTLISACLFS